jgi:hypothetical protein
MATQILVNTISKNTGTAILCLDPIGLASYTTSERDLLTSVAGDIIFNSTTGTSQFYDGTAWRNF